MASNKFVPLKLMVFLAMCQMLSCAVNKGEFVISISKSHKNYPAYLRKDNDTKFNPMPHKQDLNTYLKAIRNLLRFSKSALKDLDVNYSFGLFLINVNLKTALRNKHKLPKALLQEVQDIIEHTTELLDFYYLMVKLDNKPDDLVYKHISALFSNDSMWVERVTPFSQSARIDPKWYNKYLYSSWHQYTEMITSNPGQPGPTESDACISSMIADAARTQTRTKCTLHTTCYHILSQGSEVGYAFTHRLLLILAARFGRGCFIYSVKEDMELTQRICSNMYYEAQFIADNNYRFIDLITEQIALCSLAGYREFLQRSWLNNIIQRQRVEGCFGNRVMVSKVNRAKVSKVYQRQLPANGANEWIIAKNIGGQGLLGGLCNGHLTAVAAGALSAGARLVISQTDFTTIRVNNSTNTLAEVARYLAGPSPDFRYSIDFRGEFNF